MGPVTPEVLFHDLLHFLESDLIDDRRPNRTRRALLALDLVDLDSDVGFVSQYVVKILDREVPKPWRVATALGLPGETIAACIEPLRSRGKRALIRKRRKRLFYDLGLLGISIKIPFLSGINLYPSGTIPPL